MAGVHAGDVSGAIIDGMPEYEHLCIPIEYDPQRHCKTQKDGKTRGPKKASLLGLSGLQKRNYRFSSGCRIYGPGNTSKRHAPGLVRLSSGPIGKPGMLRRPKRLASKISEDGTPKYPPFEFVLASADTAYTEKEENDPTGFTIWGLFRDREERPKVMLMWAWTSEKSYTASFLSDCITKATSLTTFDACEWTHGELLSGLHIRVGGFRLISF